MTTTERGPYLFVTKVIDLFNHRLKQRRELNELAEYAADPEWVARELPGDFEMLVRHGSPVANELSYTLTALDIDETALWRTEPTLLRDMEHVCLLCTHKWRCHQALSDGTPAMNYLEYCENSDTFDTLRFRS